jgi:hypothetical protein
MGRANPRSPGPPSSDSSREQPAQRSSCPPRGLDGHPSPRSSGRGRGRPEQRTLESRIPRRWLQMGRSFQSPRVFRTTHGCSAS